jgi:hypothetical protein
MQSKITGGDTELLFTTKVLNKYNVNYYQCKETGFIQTEHPYWLPEAYSSAITKLDIGLVSRNEGLRETVIPVINNYFDANAKFLDYAGGYGLFTRQMRDKGFDFYHTDMYCQNLFAEYFDLTDTPAHTKFELATAFEVFEHLPDPIEELQKIGEYTDNILFSTVLQPKAPITAVNDWWYFIPETGQHVALYNEKSLLFLGAKFGYNFYTDGISTHLFTKNKLAGNPFEKAREPMLIRKMRKILKRFDQKANPDRETLLHKDFQYIKNKLR